MICSRCGKKTTAHMKSEQVADIYLRDEHGKWIRADLCLDCDRELYKFVTNGQEPPELIKKDEKGVVRRPTLFKGMRF